LPVGHPAELRLTHVAVGDVEVAASYAAELASLGAGIDFARLGVAANLSVQAADGRGAPRPDRAIEVHYQEAAVTEVNAALTVTLPRTTLVGGPYLVKITATAKTPTGEAFTAATPPRGLEVPPGKYTIRVTALGRESPPSPWKWGQAKRKLWRP